MRLKLNINTKSTRIEQVASVNINVFYTIIPFKIDEGIRLFEILNKYSMLPEKFDTKYEKMRKYDFLNYYRFLDEYWYPYVEISTPANKHTVAIDDIQFERTKAPGYNIYICRKHLHDKHVDFTMYFKVINLLKHETNIMAMLKELICYAPLDYGRVQLFTYAEEGKYKVEYIARGINNIERVGETFPTIGSPRLKKYIPDLYNVSVWGKPYIDMIGREKLLSMPCYKAEEIAPDLIWTQLSPHVFDERGSWEALREAREAGKRHLDDNMFFNHRLPEDHVYRVPEFDFSEINRAMQLPEERGEV